MWKRFKLLAYLFLALLMPIFGAAFGFKCNDHLVGYTIAASAQLVSFCLLGLVMHNLRR